MDAIEFPRRYAGIMTTHETHIHTETRNSGVHICCAVQPAARSPQLAKRSPQLIERSFIPYGITAIQVLGALNATNELGTTSARRTMNALSRKEQCGTNGPSHDEQWRFREILPEHVERLLHDKQTLWYPSNMVLAHATEPFHMVQPVSVRESRACWQHLASCQNIARLPAHSFVQLSDGTVLPSPELAFVQAMTGLTAADRVRLGLTMCGTYTVVVSANRGEDTQEVPVAAGTSVVAGTLGRRGKLRQSEAAPEAPVAAGRVMQQEKEPSDVAVVPHELKTVYHVQPLTSKAKLRAFIEACPQMRGVGLARKALTWVSDGAASPRETDLYLMCVLPTKLGGFQLGIPELNYRIDLRKRASQMAGRQFVLCDMYWSRYRVALEYDSDEFHTLKRAEDINRAQALAAMGIRVVTVTTRQFNDFNKLVSCMYALRDAMGIRNRKPNPDHMYQRRELLWHLHAYSPLFGGFSGDSFPSQ